MKWPPIKMAHVLGLMLTGALGFWLPDVALHALRGQEFNGRDVRIVTAVAPLTLLITFLLVKWAFRDNPQNRVGLLLLAGVWLFGGVFMMVSASFSPGGGFVTPGGGRVVVMWMLLSLLPVYTYIMATYDGSLLALLVVTIAAFLVWIVQRSGILVRFCSKPPIEKTL
jgi:hypothetical protein